MWCQYNICEYLKYGKYSCRKMGLPPLGTVLLITLLFTEALSSLVFPVVRLLQGSVRGRRITANGIPFYGFQGIPYAKPPVGDLRFKAPAAPEPWIGIRNAMVEGQLCSQYDRVANTIIGDEDCLFINVYTPELPSWGRRWSVMVWIHGGSFLTGSGTIIGQGPEYFLAAGVMYVTVNYRLGAQGFLCTEDEASPGNLGLKDQSMALRWVHDNIIAFGGDPQRVTIIGDSSGGASVQFHMLSEQSRGLFQNAISQSGSVLSPWSIARKPREMAFLLGQSFGYSGNNSEELVQFLRTRSTEELAKNSIDLGGLAGQISPIFVPCIENAAEEHAPFLIDQPLELIHQGQFAQVPYITGVTSKEGIYVLSVAGIASGSKSLEVIDSNLEALIKPDLKFCQDDPCAHDIISRIRSYYVGDEPLTSNNVYDFIDMTTDFYFAEGVLMGVRKMTALASAPIFLYQFTYDGELAFLKHVNPLLRKYPGVAHVDDVGYLLDNGVQVAVNSIENKVRFREVAMWTNFAKTGNPTPEALGDIPKWPTYDLENEYYMEIGSKLTVKQHLKKEQVDFWESLYDSNTTRST